MSAASTDKPAIITPQLPAERWFPGWVSLLIVVGSIATVAWLRLTYSHVDRGMLDLAFVNIITYVLSFLAFLTLWLWFTFQSSYSLAVRRVIFTGTIVAVFLVFSLVRVDGVTGNMEFTGFRWVWQKPRDYARAIPTPAKQENTSETAATAEQDPVSSREDAVIATTGDDFPEFLGPNRNAYLPDAKLSHDWTTTPPKLLWRKPVGAGWAAFSVVGDHAVTLEQYGDDEVVTCRDLATGEVLWTHVDAARHVEFMGGIGPRSTPTIRDNKVYTIGATGKLNCLSLSTGKLIWKDDLRKRYGLEPGEEEKLVMWGRANSPLIYGDLCIVPGGGKSPVSLVAFDKSTGELRWQGGGKQISYASPAVCKIAGKDQIVTVNENDITGHDPESGAELWAYDWPGNSSQNASNSQPHDLGDGKLLFSKGYGQGAAVVQVTEDHGKFHVKPLWTDKKLLKTKFTNVCVIDKHAYGLSDGLLECVDLETGKQKWKARRRYEHGQVLGAGDVILVLTEKTGEVAMVAVDPTAFRELGVLQALDATGQAWNNLCLVGKKLLIRNADEAACFELP